MKWLHDVSGNTKKLRVSAMWRDRHQLSRTVGTNHSLNRAVGSWAVEACLILRAAWQVTYTGVGEVWTIQSCLAPLQT